jgi:hypothetical protein
MFHHTKFQYSRKLTAHGSRLTAHCSQNSFSLWNMVRFLKCGRGFSEPRGGGRCRVLVTLNIVWNINVWNVVWNLKCGGGGSRSRDRGEVWVLSDFEWNSKSLCLKYGQFLKCGGVVPLAPPLRGSAILWAVSSERWAVSINLWAVRKVKYLVIGPTISYNRGILALKMMI